MRLVLLFEIALVLSFDESGTSLVFGQTIIHCKKVARNFHNNMFRTSGNVLKGLFPHSI